jgi:hypothetical protein
VGRHIAVPQARVAGRITVPQARVAGRITVPQARRRFVPFAGYGR